MATELAKKLVLKRLTSKGDVFSVTYWCGSCKKQQVGNRIEGDFCVWCGAKFEGMFTQSINPKGEVKDG